MSPIRRFLATIRDPDFPYRPGWDPMPYLMRNMFWGGVWMSLGAVLFLALNPFLGDNLSITLHGQEARNALASDVVIPLMVAVIGIALAYGIWAQRVYPRYLAMLVFIAGAVWANVDMYQTRELSWGPIAAALGAIGSVRYLWSNPGVVDYYSRLGSSRSVHQPEAQDPIA